MTNHYEFNTDTVFGNDIQKFLDDVENTVSKDRAKDYGNARENFDRIASLWSALTGTKMTRFDVAMFMIAHKLSRLQNNPHHRDSWRDIAGYAALAGTFSKLEF